MKIALLGYDRQGKSAYDYFSKQGHKLTICDKKTRLASLPQDVDTKLGDDYLADLDQFDLLVRTPGLHPESILDANPDAVMLQEKITTVTNEFLRVCPTKNIVGVTGTKGKGTTSTLLSRMLHAAGKRVHLGGNIGIPPLELLQGAGLLHGEESPNIVHGVNQSSGPSAAMVQPDDWVVLELANFQLIDLQFSPKIAVCLMIAPEHLDWHSDIDEYLRAKQQLFVHQTEHDIAIYNAQDNRSIHLATTSLGTHIPYMEEPGAFVKDDEIWLGGKKLCHKDDIHLLGEHNLENVCAAATAAWQITEDHTSIARAAKSTKPLPFRIEKRATTSGITYYNDSFATNPDATIAAIRAVEGPKVLLLGGHDRGLDFTSLADQINNQDNEVEYIITFGESGKRIASTLQESGVSNIEAIESKQLQDVITASQKQATKGSAVVFSPACASFDMFKNFEERGKQFNEIIEKL